jgi:hypothetical protein
MGNIALNKPALANSTILPYAPSRAVDGTMAASNRWVCDQLPGWLRVDLGASYLVNQWVVKNMPVITDWAAPDYVNVDFKLQGSLDGSNWFDIDSVYGNTVATINRQINPTVGRFFRVFITKGLTCNKQTASIVEFELYQTYNNQLSSLTINAGTLTPAFNSTVFAYTDTVGPDVASINITPTAKDPQAIIKINNVVSLTGQPKSVDLAIGVNNIVINVTAGDSSQNNYTIVVTRQGNANLKSLQALSNGMVNVPLNPAFDKGITAYTAKTDSDAIEISYIPTSEDPQATIKLDGSSTPNGSISGATVIGSGITSSLEVTATTGEKKTYNVAVSKNTSAYLTSVTLTGGRTAPAWNTPFVKTTFNYNVTAYATPLTGTIKKEDAAATLYVTCNGSVLTPTSTTGDTSIYSIPLNTGSNSLVLRVTSTSGDVKTYTLSITK